jgi:aminoglycoside phosphotransferase (APT) family kinase protein
VPDGRLLATGRATEVFALGEDAVLRRYREGEPCDVEREAAAMTFLRDSGYPVPAVHDAGGREMVMERIEGPTMLEDLGKRPWRLFAYARALAELHERLHAVRAPEWLTTHRRLPAGGEGDSVLHLDLHPDNVIVSPSGPVVIDWSNASRGHPAVDVALTWVIMETSTIPGTAPLRVLGRFGRNAFLDAFLRRVDREAARALVPTIARERVEGDPHVLPEEATKLRVLAES